MKKLENWHQGTPQDQASAIIAGIAGWLNNLETGCSTPKRVAEAVTPKLGELLALSSWLKDSWEDEPTNDSGRSLSGNPESVGTGGS
jgi:hypothetical protein